MRRMRIGSLICVARRGLSLLEVLCALAILGTVLACSVGALSRAQRDLMVSRQRLRAIAGLDTLVRTGTPWRPGASPGANEGTLAGAEEMRWTCATRKERSDDLEFTISRLEVLGAGGGAPLAWCEIVVSIKTVSATNQR